ncbi:T9SS type A sorting domain-containing protein [Flammeovirga pectinis]|uniref:T9SS type A sorting domain-containing protein n=1 Tax=Flammeovirga pectinis TaxID=2494373 RepID=A0A3Q9FQY9_9BACT|nr:T9SS type A sorting domain-containing protein [Flammeovirga pectinis]AZQ64002.1 T9SS type A sorting domain-containing protein [Flammeovirga pectinis]
MIHKVLRALKVIFLLTFTVCILPNTNAQIIQETHSVQAIGGTLSEAGNYQHFASVGNLNLATQGGNYVNSSAFMSTSAAVDTTQSNTIDIYVNMNWAINEGYFYPATDSLDIAGSMNEWQGGLFLTDPDSDGIYYAHVPEFSEFQYEYKVRINASWNTAEFPGGSNRIVDLEAGENTINIWYNNENLDNPMVTFQLDITDALSIGDFPVGTAPKISLTNRATQVATNYDLKYINDTTYTITSYLFIAEDTIDYAYSLVDYYEPNAREYIVTENDNTITDTLVTDGLIQCTFTLNVDMNYQIDKGAFNPATDSLDAAGSFNSWSGSNLLLDADQDGIYSADFSTNEIGNIQFKTRLNRSWDWGQHEFRGDTARTYYVDDSIHYSFDFAYNDEYINNPEVVFAVNMDKQIADGNFDPAIDHVELATYFAPGSVKNYYLLQQLDGNTYGIHLRAKDTEEVYNYSFLYKKNDESEEVVYEDESNTFLVPAEGQYVEKWFNNDFNSLEINVDMTLPIARGVFDPAVDTLDFASNLNSYGNGENRISFQDLDQDGIYTLYLQEFVQLDLEFKCKINNSWEHEMHEIGEATDRKHQLTTGQNVIDIFYGDENSAYPITTFNVDLSKQISDGNFDAPRLIDLIVFKEEGDFQDYHYILKPDTGNVYTTSIQLLDNAEEYIYKYRIVEYLDTGRIVYKENDFRNYTVDATGTNTITDTFDDYTFPTSVEFLVDMNAEIYQNRFNPSEDYVDIAGDFNEWGNGEQLLLSDDNNDGIYTIKLENGILNTINFKARKNGSWELGAHEYGGTDATRMEYITPNQEKIISFSYNDELLSNPITTFEVNMEKAIYTALYNPTNENQSLHLKVMGEDSTIVKHRYLLELKENRIYTATSQLKNVSEAYTFKVVIETEVQGSAPTKVEEYAVRNYSVLPDSGNLIAFDFNNETLVNSLQLTVDMRWAAENNRFNPDSHAVNFIGSLSNWQNDIVLTDDNQDLIYSAFIDSIPTLSSEFKIRLNDSWKESELGFTNNRLLNLERGENTLAIFYDRENRDNPITSFEVDMSKIVLENELTNQGAVLLYVYENEQAEEPIKGYALTNKYDYVYGTSSQIKEVNASYVYKLAYKLSTEPETFEDNFRTHSVLSTTTLFHHFNNEEYYTGLTFTVDMNGMIENGRFNPANDTLDVVGSMTGWNTNPITLSDDNNDNIYQGSFEINNHTEDTITFKTRINGSWNDLMHEYPGGGQVRSVVPEKGETQSIVFDFDDENVDNTAVIFKVNMAHQITLEKFDPTIEGAELRIKLFDGEQFSSYPLLQDEDGLYSFTTQKFEADSTFSFKVMYQYPNDSTIWDITEENETRAYVKASSQQTISFWFNDEIPEERFTAVWQVNMQSAINFSDFDVANDVVSIKGSFDNWADEVELTKSDSSNIYTASVSLPESIIYYQLFVNGVAEAFVAQDESNNRSHHLAENNTVINVVYNFEEVEKITEDEVQTTEGDDGTVIVEIAITVFEELEGAVTYQVMLANGDPLPDWIIFDPETMTFTVDLSKIPSGARVEDLISDLDIIILANDETGKSVAVEVTLPTEEIIADAQEEEDDEDVNGLEDELAALWNVYPTLVEDRTLIVPPTSEKYVLSIYTSTGKKVLEKELEGEQNILLPNLTSGLYILKINTQNLSIEKKIVKK